MSSSPSGPGSRTSRPGRGRSSAIPDVRFVGVNTASWDAHKQGALPVIGDAKVSLEAIDAALGDVRRATRLAGDGRRADRRVARLPRFMVGAAARGAAGLRRGDPGDQRRRATPRTTSCRRPVACPASWHGLALEGGRHVRLGVRLLDDGLRDRRAWGARLARRDGRRHRLGRRRLVPDDELGHLLDRDDRPEGHLHASATTAGSR